MSTVIIPAELNGRLLDDPPDGPAVYFLFRDGRVVYVGASVAPNGRVEFHRARRDRVFDLALYLPTPADELDEAERLWIGRCVPVHNKLHNPRPSPDDPCWGSVPLTGRVMVRLDIPNDRKEELRVLAARSDMSMAEYCRLVVLEAVRKGRTVKADRKEK